MTGFNAHKGPDVDPVTGLPLESLPGRGHLTSEREKSALREKAALARVLESEPAETLRQTIREHLYKRITKLLTRDVESRAYVNILATMNEQEDLARWAVKKLSRLEGP